MAVRHGKAAQGDFRREPEGPVGEGIRHIGRFTTAASVLRESGGSNRSSCTGLSPIGINLWGCFPVFAGMGYIVN